MLMKIGQFYELIKTGLVDIKCISCNVISAETNIFAWSSAPQHMREYDIAFGDVRQPMETVEYERVRKLQT